jgi:hypothetical protein
MGGPEEVHIGGKVLAEKLEPEPPLPLRSLGRLPVEPLFGLGFHPAELAEQLG